jgi:uncharacterized protein (TIRG00374 family)
LFFRRAAARSVAIIVGVVIFLSAFLLIGDTREIGQALDHFSWWLLPPALLLTLWNYGLRFAKWQLYLRQLDVRGLPVGISLLVFLSAFAMSITPGKVGELLKCVLLRQFTGAPVSRSTAIVVAERLTDGLAMIILASAGVLQFTLGRWVIGIAIIGGVCAIALLRRPIWFRLVIRKLPAIPLLTTVERHTESFLEASGALLRPRPLLLGAGMGIIAWLGECAALYLILVGLGLTPSWDLFAVAVFTLSISSLAGALSMVPGGLGVAEASVAAMLVVLVADDAMNRGLAVAAALLIRLATLWFAVVLGAIALVIVRRLPPGRWQLDAKPGT